MFRNRVSIVCICAAAISASAIEAYARPKPTPEEPATPATSSLEKQILSLAKDFSKRSEKVLSRWIERGEVTPEKLFSALYFPEPDTNPQKYSTDWDKLADRDIGPITNQILNQSSSILFAVLVDRNGYLPAKNGKNAYPFNGDPGHNRDRSKTLYQDRIGLISAKSKQPYLVQNYDSFTGKALKEISVPVYYRNSHWGAVRIAFEVD